MLQLVLSDSLPFAFVLALQPIPDFWDLRERNGEESEELAKWTTVPSNYLSRCLPVPTLGPS